MISTSPAGTWISKPRSLCLDVTLPVFKWLTLLGELFSGENLDQPTSAASARASIRPRSRRSAARAAGSPPASAPGPGGRSTSARASMMSMPTTSPPERGPSTPLSSATSCTRGTSTPRPASSCPSWTTDYRGAGRRRRHASASVVHLHILNGTLCEGAYLRSIPSGERGNHVEKCQTANETSGHRHPGDGPPSGGHLRRDLQPEQARWSRSRRRAAPIWPTRTSTTSPRTSMGCAGPSSRCSRPMSIRA